MRNRYFYIPILSVAALTVVLAYFVLHVDASQQPLQGLLVNLLASGVTVIFTSLIIDRSIRNERKRDSRPGLSYVKKMIGNELEWFFRNVGFIQIALDTGKPLGSELIDKDRDLTEEYHNGLRIAKTMTTKTFAGQTKYALGWIADPTERVINVLEETLGNFSYALSFTDLTKLYELKKELRSTLTQVKQSMSDDLEDFAEGYYSPDEGYVNNRDYQGDQLSSMKAYEINRLVHLVLAINNVKLNSTST